MWTIFRIISGNVFHDITDTWLDICLFFPIYISNLKRQGKNIKCNDNKFLKMLRVPLIFNLIIN